MHYVVIFAVYVSMARDIMHDLYFCCGVVIECDLVNTDSENSRWE